jgi:glycosyltransferase involved in cell wall biosynthesis
MNVVYISPIASRSGYGDCAREFGEFLLNKYKDISFMSTRWGDSGLSELDTHTKINDKIKTKLTSTLPDDIDILYQMSLPSEFNPLGKFNVGLTAGLEFLGWSDEFIHGCNRMQKIIVPSKFTKEAMLNSEHNSIECTTDVDVVFEGVDDLYLNPVIESTSDIDEDMSEIDESFCFLSMGIWTTENDRKNITSTIKTFQQSFSNTKKDVALVLKINGPKYNTKDVGTILRELRIINSEYKNPKSVYLIYGNLTKTEICKLYKHPKIKCMVSLTHGEGFGRPLLEASVIGLPIIASKWSGHLDFLPKKFCQLVSGKINKITEPNPYKTTNSAWFYPDESVASKFMLDCVDRYGIFKKRAEQLANKNLEKYNKSEMFKLYDDIVNNI